MKDCLGNMLIRAVENCSICFNNSGMIMRLYKLSSYNMKFVGIQKRILISAKMCLYCPVCNSNIREKDFYCWSENLNISSVLYDFGNSDFF